MIIRRPRRPELRLGYEMNAHPAATLGQLRSALDSITIPVSRRLAPEGPFGIVPHIGEGLSRDLARPAARAELREELLGAGLFPFSVNAFPLRDFHARRVKEQVYLPSWAHHRRVDVTKRIGDQLAELLPEGEAGTISTLGGAYRPTGNSPARRRKIAENYVRTAAHFAQIERDRGVFIALAAEPEPDTTFEVAEDVTSLLEEEILPAAKAILPAELGIAKKRVEETLFRFFAVNLDVCHASVMFRDPVEEWKTLESAGLRIAKLHLTNALSLPRPGNAPHAVEEILGYHEPRYLHQTVARRSDGSLWRGADLPDLRSGRREASEWDEVRVHFHVPLSRARLGALRTTRPETAAALHHALRHPDPPHLVIETYTWPYFAKKATRAKKSGSVRPTATRASERQSRDERTKVLIDGIVDEFRWVLGEIEKGSARPEEKQSRKKQSQKNTSSQKTNSKKQSQKKKSRRKKS